MQRLPGAIFQQDNVRPHTASVSQDCLRTVTTLPWPIRSPDSSLIEHIWDHLERRVGHPTSLNELEASLRATSDLITADIDTAPEELQLELDLQSDHSVKEMFYAMTLIDCYKFH
ncbi:transposable element Tcb2 transposase [Trichonephila clavipes]|nr:transposable element Tcb2 transposase [Trichonephila clavipes]